MNISRYVIAFIFFIFISSTVNAQAPESIETALASLRENCKYSLGEEIFLTISNANTSISSDAVVVRFNLDIPFSRHEKNGAAELIFGCNAKQSESRAENVDSVTIKLNGTTTARKEILNQDSGGRYGRVIEWQKEYQGENFRGTVAYVGSIFGDGIMMPTAEQFYVCPEVSGFVCFSLTFDESLRLTEHERLDTMKMLQHVKILSTP